MSSSRVQVDSLPPVQVHVWCECEAVTAGAGKVVYAQTPPPHCRCSVMLGGVGTCAPQSRVVRRVECRL